MAKTAVVGIRLTPEQVEKLDRDRGQVSRAEWVSELIQAGPDDQASITLEVSDEFAAKLDAAAEAAAESRSEYIRKAVELRLDPPVIGKTKDDRGTLEKGVAVGPGPAPTRPPPKAPTVVVAGSKPRLTPTPAIPHRPAGPTVGYLRRSEVTPNFKKT